jgi:hypothetical protein
MAELDALTLTSDFPIIIKDSFSSIQASIDLAAIQTEANRFVCGDLRGLLQPAKISGGKMDEESRGDLHCWLSPEVCKDHALVAIKSYIMGLKAYCGTLGSTMSDILGCKFLNEGLSIQLAYYVSAFL